ncbi:MAG TPA: hypothetical protein VJ656_13155 [Pyrinomonadaceae bacterium]|nr:hypothetical protein [Pyrinomonadaceae bacterium]
MLKLLLVASLALSVSGCSASENASLTWVGTATYRGAQLPTTVRFFNNSQGISATIAWNLVANEF